jgi:hypothetical protein
MAHTAIPNTVVGRLVRELLDPAREDRAAEELAEWLTESARFRGFAAEHRAKIRKKLIGAADPEARKDVRAELQFAHLLLADRRFELAYEAYGSGKAGPDFTVTFRTVRTFNVEVTRLHGERGLAGYGLQLLAKLPQLPASAPNAVVVAIQGESVEDLDAAAAFRDIRARAESKDESFFTSRGLAGTREFYGRYLRLGAVLVWAEGATADAQAVACVNRSARIALPAHAGGGMPRVPSDLMTAARLQLIPSPRSGFDAPAMGGDGDGLPLPPVGQPSLVGHRRHGHCSFAEEDAERRIVGVHDGQDRIARGRGVARTHGSPGPGAELLGLLTLGLIRGQRLGAVGRGAGSARRPPEPRLGLDGSPFGHGVAFIAGSSESCGRPSRTEGRPR